MPTQVEKLKAQTEHLIDGFIGLREKWTLLKPMLSSQELIAAYRGGQKSRGFISLQRTLALSCATDIANLCRDKYPETPSLFNCNKTLADPHLRSALRREYSHSVILPMDPDESDPEALAEIKQLTRKKSRERAIQFDLNHAEFVAAWSAFESSTALKLFSAVRDKIAAHSELHFVNGRYSPVTLGSLGIKATHFDEAIQAMQPIVERIQNLTRSAGFSWESLEKQLNRGASAFWSMDKP